MDAVYIAPYASPVISLDTLFDPTSGALLSSLPEGYIELGTQSSAGAVFARATKSTDLDSWPSDTPTSVEITSDLTRLTIEPCNANQATMALFNALTTAPTFGSNSTLIPNRWRVLALAIGITDAGDIVYARFLPRARVATFADTSDPVKYGVTIVAYHDADAGTPEQFFFGGEGLPELQVDMGYEEELAMQDFAEHTTPGGTWIEDDPEAF
jgi:hypothetical protein